jgi:hypothetical protein
LTQWHHCKIQINLPSLTNVKMKNSLEEAWFPFAGILKDDVIPGAEPL